MCIAILKTKDKILDKDTLETCSKNNPDGCGFAYRNNEGKIIIKKFMNFESFWKEYSKVQEHHTMLIHFRIATHGKVELANCHPFKLNNHMALIHNGIISGYGSKTENLSDTRDFIEKVIGNISYKMWKNPSFIKLVGSSIGYSKFVILDNNENYYIVNEEKGIWDDGVWYSNSSYKPKTTTVSATAVPSKDSGTVKTSFGYIMKCTKCGKEKVTNKWNENVCECGSKMEQIGYQYGDERKYYCYDTSYSDYDRYGYYDYWEDKYGSYYR